MVDSVTGEPVETEEQIKGYAVGKDQYVTVEDDELANIALESTRTVDIEKFVPKASIDDRYRDTPYYLAPEDKVGQEAFAVIRDAMKKKKMVGIGRVVMARRERVMMLEPFGKGIMGTTLHYPVRDPRRGIGVRGHPGDEAAGPDGRARGGDHRSHVGRVRAGQIRGSLRERDDRTHSLQASRIAGTNRESTCAACQRRQSDGCVAAQHRGRWRQGESQRRRGKRAAAEATPAKKRAKKAG